MKDMIKRFVKEEEGLELVEYAVMAGLIVAVLIATIGALGQTIDDRFGELDAAVQGDDGSGG